MKHNHMRAIMNAMTTIFNSGVGAQVIDVTPEMAEQILSSHNHKNRDIKKSVVVKYARMMEMGDWKFTPETICVSTTGRLLQGQHRMLAVIKSGVTCRFLFATGFSDDVFDALDRGAGRTAADSLGINKKLAEASKLLASLSTASGVVSDADTLRASFFIEDQHAALMDHCKSSVRLFSNAPMRLAAIARVKSGADSSYVFGLYRKLVLKDTTDLPPIGHAIIKSFLNDSLESGVSGSGGGRQLNLLSLGWTLYDPEQRNRKRISFTRNEASIAHLIKATGYET